MTINMVVMQIINLFIFVFEFRFCTKVIIIPEMGKKNRKRRRLSSNNGQFSIKKE